ncbi:MAG: RNA methyltransferase [Syntrophomonas sp.]|nr:RNA methyltransferase [Syntrophomonas sp.]
MRTARVYIALLHYPMYNKRMDTITTSITNLDLHDIARAARTYDVEGFFVVHPSVSQRKLMGEILAYWQDGYGGCYNPDRQEAFKQLRVAENLNGVIDSIQHETGQRVYTVATDARIYPNTISYKRLKQELFDKEQVFLLLFGTGWGMVQELVEGCDYILEPIDGAGEYNHLSVRSAVSIILDRLLGQFWYDR